MKIKCTKERLLQATTTAERISGKNLTLPVLNALLLEASGKSFVIKATNLELGIEVSVPAEVEAEGSVAVSGSVLHGTLGALVGDPPVVLAERDGNLLVEAGGGAATLKGKPADDFPTIPKLTEAESFTVPAERFARGVRSVVYSASVSAIKPEQASVYLYKDNNQLCFVATDSFRLAEKKIEVGGSVPDFDPILVPARNMVEILRVLDQVGGDVEIRLGGSQIAFQLDGVYLTSRLVDGAFPDYRQVIPKNAVTEVVVLKQDIVQLFKKLSVFSDTSNQVSLHLEPGKGGDAFRLEARNADVGETKDGLAGEVTGDPLDINFNYRYIAECFSSIPTDSVTLSFSGLGRPLVVRGLSDPSFLYLVMPMNK